MFVSKSLHQFSIQELARCLVVHSTKIASDWQRITVLDPGLHHVSSLFFFAMTWSILGGLDNMEKGAIRPDNASSTMANLCRDVLSMKDEVFKAYHEKGIVSLLPILMIPTIP